MQIAIRLDDITPDMDWERFLAFKEILDGCGVKPLIGVVPDNRDENLHRAKAAGDFWEYVKELQEDGWCVALHGWRHLYTTKKGGLFPLNKFSEFAGVPFAKQKEMLLEATEILKKNGIQTDIFMAPAHSYDKNTLKALKELGYDKLTDGFGSRPYRRLGMTFYPISFLLRRSQKKRKGATTMVVHTNEIDEAGMARMKKLLTEQKDNLISYGDYLAMKSREKGFWGCLTEYVLASIKRVLVKLKSGAAGG